ncbi:MAG TPA: carboxyl transferase domain-containing protein [Terriglobales bacterium]|nr:carboxyl transferase domain-containing protein [Terriglobales bacterium]
MEHEFQRVAIVNRGEPAVRFIHAVREYNQEHDLAISTIALYTDPDRRAMFVREADEAVSLGPAQVIDQETGQPKSSYVDYRCLQRALATARADAVWVGWGFVAEHAAFAELCSDLGIVFIGPSAAVMRRLGDKIAAKLLAEQAGISVAPWGGGPVDTLDDASRHAEHLGYPLFIKATAGGGGHGIRIVRSAEELGQAFASARSEAFKAFGDPTVFLEQVVPQARHVEVQIIADEYGTTWAAGVRDCTIQRRQQKVLEEAPSPALSRTQDRQLREMAVRLSQSAGYTNAGTVEFLYQPQSRRFFFMEVNTRLQVEHPVTECTTGLDLVKLQIHVARGGRLKGEPPRTVGHAIEVRLNAEDPCNHFAPAPGIVERFRILSGPGIRVDTGVTEGDIIPAHFDSMIAKIIAHGQNRREAISRLQRSLRESVLVIKGGASNKSFLLQLLAHEQVKEGTAHVCWLDLAAKGGDHVSRRYADVALVQTAIESYEAQLEVEQKQFFASAARGRPQVHTEIGRSADLRYQGQSYSPRVYRLGPQEYRVDLDTSRVVAHIERLGEFEYWLTMLGRRFHIVSVSQGQSYRVEVDGVSHQVDRDDGGIVHAPAPAVVVSIAVKPGDEVSIGDRLAVLEAMKMEMPVTAPLSGKVRQVLVIPNVQVDTGAPLVQIDPAFATDAAKSPERVVMGASCISEVIPVPPLEQKLKQLRQLMLGFDVDPKQSSVLLADLTQNYATDSGDLTEQEDEILRIFVDICSLFQREPEVDHRNSGEEPSAENYLFSYLRMIDTGGEGLPKSFVDALRRALAHYGVQSLDRSRELEQSLLWIYKSHQRVERQVSLVVAVLEKRLREQQTPAPHAGEEFRAVLDRLVSMSTVLFPAIADLAREVRYRCFDQPLFEKARRQVYEQLENHLAYLAANPETADRNERIRALVECPQPLAFVFCRRFAASDAGMRKLMLEAITRRFYRIRNLMAFRSMEAGEHCYTSTQYDHEEKRIHVFATCAEYSRLSEAVRATLPLIAEVPASDDVVLDFYTWCPDEPADPEITRQQAQTVLNQAGFMRPIRRIVVAVGSTNDGRNLNSMRYFTFRHRRDGYEEEEFFRGLHPMMGKRLHLWRLSNFKIDRLPSAEDVYLIHAVARDNPKDERLFGCAEVRDSTPVRDDAGHIVALPHLERMFMEAVAGMRLFQSQRQAQHRLHWNRILLYVWEPLMLTRSELNLIVQRLAPAARGLGLELVVVRARIPNPATGELRDMAVRISNPAGTGMLVTFRPATLQQPIKPLSEYEQKVVRMRQRGLVYPYEIIKMLTPSPEDGHADFPTGDFLEHDLDENGHLARVDRPYGQNRANIIVGLIRNFTSRYPEGMTRVALLGDPSKDLGALAEAECRRIIAALDLAHAKRVPLEWFPISAGAKISMNSGVENMDWIARVLRRLVEFTQAGGEVNLLIDGVNVGAQPYWNAEATMLMHTRGILVMTPKAAMVLTGKRALDYSGGISAEDNQGIGGYDRIMGVNGQAQYWAKDINEACRILFAHYEHTYVAPGERFPRRAVTNDPLNRDVQQHAHDDNGGEGFKRVGEIFSDEANPGRKKSFQIRKVMTAVADQDHEPLERWAGMRAAETVVVWDAHLGGYPVCLIGIESKPVPRLGFVPADGPDQWCAGTLFPQSSKKAARAINAASHNRPVVILANLSGFDGSPESMRRLQLEYGAEIGRAVVNFKGPIVFCVISRYHGGAYVVFSRALNENLAVAALEGTYASVIGGAPAAAVVFAGEVEARARKDDRLKALGEALTKAEGTEKGRLRTQWDELFKVVHSEKLGEVAAEFDSVHSVQRALEVGALHRIIPPAELRPYLIDAVQRGINKAEESFAAQAPGGAEDAIAEAA